MTENIDLSILDKMKTVPTSLLTDITPKEMESIADHTKIPLFNDMPLNGSQPGLNGHSGIPGQPGQNGQPGQALKVGNLVNAKMAMQLVNILIPTLLTIVLKQFSKKQVSKRSLEATKDERDVIEPVLQNYLQSISFNVDKPINALILTMAMVYGTKVIEVINEAPNLHRPPPVSNEPVYREEIKSNSSLGKNANGSFKKDGRGRPKKR